MPNLSVGKFFSAWILFVVVSGYQAGSVKAQLKDEAQCAPAIDSQMTTVGAVEEIILSPWGVRFPARVDTGADLSSLDARDLEVRNNFAEFTLGRQWGSRRLRLPVLEWREIHTTLGSEARPVVEISICLGSKLFSTPVTLKDRSEMRYPFLVGRTALSGKFLVDPSRSKAVKPTCSDASLASTQSPLEDKQ
jgi:hypothetical protein